MTEQQTEAQPGTRYEIRLEASGVVGKGEGPDALDIPEQPDEEEEES